VYQFIKAYDLACSAVEIEDFPILMKFINTKLFDQALNVCRYRDMSDWEGVMNALQKHLLFPQKIETAQKNIARQSLGYDYTDQGL